MKIKNQVNQWLLYYIYHLFCSYLFSRAKAGGSAHRGLAAIVIVAFESRAAVAEARFTFSVARAVSDNKRAG